MLVPYAGRLSLKGKGVKRSQKSHRGLEGVEKLEVKPKGALARRLERKGRAKVKVTVKLRPSDGNVTQSASRKVKLKLES